MSATCPSTKELLTDPKIAMLVHLATEGEAKKGQNVLNLAQMQQQNGSAILWQNLEDASGQSVPDKS
eukprot:6463904-Amphidinium_carterae.1